MRYFLLSVILGLLGACEPELTAPTSDAVALINAEQWALVDTESDPFGDRPEAPECPSSGYGIEDGFFEVETDVCHYGTFSQASLLSVSKEASLRLNFWHSPLSNPEPAQAHIAFQVNDQLLWEKTIDIPNDAAVYDETISLNEAITEGDAIYFHLHNHGNNAWRLGTLEISVP